MSAVLRRILDYLVSGGDRGADLDHLPVPLQLDPEKPADWRERKLSAARARRGHAFKCAGPDQDREVMIVPGEVRIIGAGRVPTQAMVKPTAGTRASPALISLLTRKGQP